MKGLAAAGCTQLPTSMPNQPLHVRSALHSVPLSSAGAARASAAASHSALQLLTAFLWTASTHQLTAAGKRRRQQSHCSPQLVALSALCLLKAMHQPVQCSLKLSAQPPAGCTSAAVMALTFDLVQAPCAAGDEHRCQRSHCSPHPAVLSISWLLQAQHEPVRRSLQWSAASSPVHPSKQQLVFDVPPHESVFEDQENQPGAGGPMGAGMARLESQGI